LNRAGDRRDGWVDARGATALQEHPQARREVANEGRSEADDVNDHGLLHFGFWIVDFGLQMASD
jgi:hypothetical protein